MSIIIILRILKTKSDLHNFKACTIYSLEGRDSTALFAVFTGHRPKPHHLLSRPSRSISEMADDTPIADFKLVHGKRQQTDRSGEKSRVSGRLFMIHHLFRDSMEAAATQAPHPFELSPIINL